MVKYDKKKKKDREKERKTKGAKDYVRRRDKETKLKNIECDDEIRHAMGQCDSKHMVKYDKSKKERKRGGEEEIKRKRRKKESDARE